MEGLANGGVRQRRPQSHDDVALPSTQDRHHEASYSRTRRTFKGGQQPKNHHRRPFLFVISGSFFLLFVFTSSSLLSMTNTEWRRRLSADNDETNPWGTCIGDIRGLPKPWRPPTDLNIKDRPWSVDEQWHANHAVVDGLDELIDYLYSLSNERIQNLKFNAVNSLADQVYSSSEMPLFHERALRAAIRVFKITTRDYIAQNEDDGCKGVYDKMECMGYANYLSQQSPFDEELWSIRNTMVDRLNLAFRECRTLDKVLDLDIEEAFAQEEFANRDEVFGWMMSAMALTDCLTVPELEMPRGTSKFIATVWKYLEDYPITNARDVEDGFEDYYARRMAYLATHAGFMPTGYGQHVQLIKDAPWLFEYLRENFYETLESEDADLVSEFVDLLRQYGCTEDNDVHVRHGSRFLLNVYKEQGDSWMGPIKRLDGEDLADMDYRYIHKPWTGISGVNRRRPEPIRPGSYGDAFRKALKDGGYEELSSFA